MTEWTKRDEKTYGLGAAMPAGASWERRQPSRTAELAGDVLVPAMQAIITGLVGAVVGGLVGGSPGAGLTSGAVVFGLAWLVLLLDHRNALWVIERVTGADLDGDQVVGKPEAPPPTTVRVELRERHNGGQRLRWIDLPVGDDKLAAVAEAIQDGASFSRRGLSEVLTQGDYDKLSGAMLGAGLLHDVGNKRILSGSGRAMLRQITERE